MAIRFQVRTDGMLACLVGNLEFRLEREGLIYRLTVRRQIPGGGQGIHALFWEQLHTEKCASKPQGQAAADAWLERYRAEDR